MIGSSAQSRPCWRIQPQLRLDCSPATRPFSTSTTLTPASARKKAVAVPAIPAPITTTSASSGSGPAKATGVASLIIGMARDPCLQRHCPARPGNPAPTVDFLDAPVKPEHEIERQFPGQTVSGARLSANSFQRWQATSCSSPICSSFGSSLRQMSIAWGQRVWNLQPGGGLVGLGISPSSFCALPR